MKKHHKDNSEQMPLLYISQPNLKTPTAPMQQSFIIRQSNSNSAAVEQKEEDKRESILTKPAFNEAVEQEREDSFRDEMEVGAPNAATAAILEDVDLEEAEAVLEHISAEKQEAVSEVSSVEKQEAVLEVSSIEEQEAVLEASNIEEQEAVLESDSIEQQDEASISKDQEESNSIVRKAFRDLNTEEKLLYLLNRPHYIPKILCEVKTKTESHTGFIVSLENDVVMLRSQKHFVMKKILFQDIIDIRMRAL